MENIKLIEGAKTILEPFLKENNLVLYDIELVKEDGNLILRILIDNEDGLIDLNKLALANEYVSSKIDKYDSDMPEYMLEVSSPGAERVLKTNEDILKSIEKYIHIETPNMIYEGVLKEVTDEEVIVRINLKGRFKNQAINRKEINLIRLAVKF